MNRGRRSKKGSSKERNKEGEGTKSQMTKQEPSAPMFGSREDPPAYFKDQYLFLLEFFVHRVTGDRLAKLNQMFFVPTSICFQFLHFTEEDDIVVTPVDPLFVPQAGIADDVECFYSGRSVMFAIDQNTVTNKILEFIIKLTIRKKMPEGVKPDILVGVGELDLSKEFAALRKEMLQCWHKMVPPPKTYEGDVSLMYNENSIGTVNIYVRMSAFGQTVVTEFETPPERKISSYIFKGDEINEKALTYKCRIINPETVDICKESKDDLIKGGPPCRVCIKEEHPCVPCGHHAGATIKPGISNEEDGISVVQTESYSPNVSKSRSKVDTCADVHKRGGLIQSSRGPVQPCGKAVVLKVSGLLDDGSNKKPTVTVASESEAVGPGNPPDPEHDVFVLRIGKKGLVGVDEKSDIQLEMRTPKGPERRPPIRYETREMQTDDGDKGKKGKKGKKKKK